MRKIQMVDLQSQYFKIKNEVDNAVLNVFESAAFINGSEVQSFQAELEEYLGVKKCDSLCEWHGRSANCPNGA